MIAYKCQQCGFVASGFDGYRVRDERKQHIQECKPHNGAFFMPERENQHE